MFQKTRIAKPSIQSFAKKTFFTLLLSGIMLVAYSQQQGLTEQDLKKKAESFYKQQIWGEALPLYAQLVSVYPNNANYNFKYGVCALMGNRTNTKQSIRYLTIAHRSLPNNKELMYYLGLAYYQNQEFASALDFFFQSIELYGSTDPITGEINEYINSCQRGLELIHKNQLDEIMARTEFQYSNFHRAYPPDELDGSLIKKPSHFATQKEISSGENSYVYITEPRGTVYYSGYASETSDQRDLFVVTISNDGEWGDPQPLSDRVNTGYDEAYPIVTDNGNILYFSSKGHNSMGGYDVFKSNLDKTTGKFGPPENMGVGVNSPFDDILFIPLRSEDEAYFSSNRENTDDKITVYKVSLNSGMGQQDDLMAQQAISTPEEESNDMRISWEIVYEDNPAESSREVIDPVKIVQHVKYVAAQSSWLTEEEQLEIRIEPDPIRMVQPVVYTDEFYSFPIDDTILSIKLEEDPIKLVQRVKYVAAQSNLMDEEEMLEILIEADPYSLVQEIDFFAAESAVIIDDENLEIIVEEEAVKQIQAVNYATSPEQSDFDDEKLDISVEVDPYKAVETIDFVTTESILLTDDDDLEISRELEAAKQIQIVSYAPAPFLFDFDDEKLDISIESAPYKAVETIDFVTTESILLTDDENLEISRELEAAKQIQIVSYVPAPFLSDFSEEELEIIIEPELFKQVEEIVLTIELSALEIDEEQLEISNLTEITALTEPVTYNIQTTELPAEESLTMTIETEAVPETSGEVNHSDEIYSESTHLQSLTAAQGDLLSTPEPILLPEDLALKGTNKQIIKKALSRPEELSYDELLLAASLTENPEMKLQIYFNSFICIDRDWRAYYNASQAAKQSSKPDQAKLFLYQAQLISADEVAEELNRELMIRGMK